MAINQPESVLVVCQRTYHQVWMKHLRNLFTQPDGARVTIESAFNCTPLDVLTQASRVCRNAEYDEVVVVVDAEMDSQLIAKLEKEAAKKKMRVLAFPSTHESFLLSILEPKNSAQDDTSLDEASRLQDVYGLLDNEPLDKFYERHFNLSVLEEYKATNALLTDNIALIQAI